MSVLHATGPDRFRPIVNRLRLEPVRLTFEPPKTAMDCTEPVSVGSAQSFAVLEPVKTGLGFGPWIFGQKTGPDWTFKH